MNTRPLLRTDLPFKKKRKPLDTINIPVVYKKQMRYVVDIHFTNDELCFLNNAGGVPTKISELELVIPADLPHSQHRINTKVERDNYILNELESLNQDMKEIRSRIKNLKKLFKTNEI